MATITPVAIDSAGEVVTFAAASAGGDSVANASGARLLVKNASGGSINATLAGAVTCSQGSTHNVVRACAVGDTHIAIPPQCVDPTLGTCAVTYSATTSVTVAAAK